MFFPTTSDEITKYSKNRDRFRLLLCEKSLQGLGADIRWHLKNRLETIQELIEIGLSWWFSRVQAPFPEAGLMLWTRIDPNDWNISRKGFCDHSSRPSLLSLLAVPDSDEYIALAQDSLLRVLACCRLVIRRAVQLDLN